MGIYDDFADTPNRIKAEGQEINLRFVRNNDGTGTIKWNIPNIEGCDPEDIAYDGIVITVSKKPANYITTSPTDGEYYNADSTFDFDLHAGDSINVANVVVALYHDKTTTSATITDVEERTPYYVSGYAVDQVGRYHKQGTHAYSLPTGEEEENGFGEGPAIQDLEIDTADGITPKTKTGLDDNKTYSLTVEVNEECLELDDIHGSNVQTYEDLVATINTKFALLSDPILGPHYPNEGVYLVKEEEQEIFLWDGTQLIKQDKPLFSDKDPTTEVLGAYWYSPQTDKLQERASGSWLNQQFIIHYPTDPTTFTDGDVWFNGTDAWEWNGVTFCKQPTFVQNANPLLPPKLLSSSYWYDEDNGIISQRDPETRQWKEVNPIVWDNDPEGIAAGDYWYSLKEQAAFIRIATTWSELTNIRSEERNDEGELDNPVANYYWYIPSEQRLFQRNSANTAWIEINVIISEEDPTDRESCDLWWNVDPSVDNLFVWDSVNSEWDAVTDFFQQGTDPANPPKLEDGTYWFNPSDDSLQKITGLNCTPVDYIDIIYDPTNLPSGVIWRIDGEFVWKIWNGSSFSTLDVIVSDVDPFPSNVEEGRLWFKTDNKILFVRESGVWEETEYSRESLAPAEGTLFYHTINDELLEWNGTKWIEGEAIAKATIHFNRQVCIRTGRGSNISLLSFSFQGDDFGHDLIRFRTGKDGCEAHIRVDRSKGIFTEISKPIIWYDPRPGVSKLEAGPTYNQIGVGTDGSPDERRELHTIIKQELGHPSVQVELTKPQLDDCINNALLMIRKYSSYAYHRGFLFLDVFPNQQKYLLIDKCVGFNKVIDVMAIHRMRTGFHGAAHGAQGGYEAFGYAAFQQLYSATTFDILSYHLVASYIEDLQHIFADYIVYTFYEETRELRVHQKFYSNERVLLEVFTEVSEQRLLKHRELAYWIKKWAVSEAKMKLSQTRGKYQSLPGPGGSTTLNSQELITQAENEKMELKEMLLNDMAMQDPNVGHKSQFLIG